MFEEYPSTCKEAKEKGFKHYFTGKPCKNGHITLRFSCNGGCTGCKKDAWKRYYSKHSEKHKERTKKWKEGHKEWYREYKRQWEARNPDKKKEWVRRWKEENRDYVRCYNSKWKALNRDHINKYCRERYTLNKSEILVRCAERRALKNQVTPEWADKEEIEYIYKLASEKGLEVDHIVPLKSDYVCGLHTGDNLRCIPKALNSHKGNRYWPDMPEEFVNLEEE